MIPNGYCQNKPKEPSKNLKDEQCKPTVATLEISAERMTYDQTTQTFLFEENVRIRRCNMSMTCNSLRIIRDTGQNTLQQVIASGNVHIYHEKYHAVAEQAQYFEVEQKLVLRGKPRATDSETQNTLVGEEIFLFLQEGKMLATKAHMTFQSHTLSSGPRNAP